MPSPETLHLPTGGPISATPMGESATEAGAAPSDRRLPSGDMVPGCGTHSGNNASGGPSEGGKKGNKPPTEPFALAESLPMIPATLVDKILKGQYVDMCDLLQDNILLSKKSTNGGAGGGGGSEPSVGHTQRRKREFTKDEAGLLSWIQCFAAFTAIVCSQDPTRCNDLLAYMVIMVNEARRFKYQGWLTYDEMFRQSVAKSKSTTWANLNGTLYATTFLSQQKGESVTCRTCSSPDHYTHQCALYDRRPAPYYRSASPPKRKRARSKSPEKGAGAGICYAWNDGKCSRGTSCRWRHYVCLKCGEDHKAIHCTAYRKKSQ